MANKKDFFVGVGLFIIFFVITFFFISHIKNEESIKKYNEDLRINALKKAEESESESEYRKTETIIVGVIEDIKPIKLDSGYVLLFIFFKDGRIIQLRTFYGSSLIFHRNKMNIITYSRSRRTIYEVELKKEL